MGWTLETREPEHMLYMEVKFWSILRRWGSTICVPRWLNGCASLKQIRTNLCSMRYLLFVVSVSCSSVPLSVSINICWFTGSGCCTKVPRENQGLHMCVFIFLILIWYDGKENLLVPDVWGCAETSRLTLLGMQALERENAAFGGSAARQTDAFGSSFLSLLFVPARRGREKQGSGHLLFPAKKPRFLTGL